MLILLPPSEGKTAPETGPVLDLGSLLAAKTLTDHRLRVIRELESLGGGSQAAKVLGLGPRAATEAVLNTRLRSAPCAPALQLFTGVLYEAAGLTELYRHPEGAALVHKHVAIVSGLWGLLRATDLVPDHRLSIGVRLPGAGKLASFWKPVLEPVLDDLAGTVVIDCRSGAYSPVWQPGKDSQVTLLPVSVRTRRPDGSLAVVSHHAKHARGLLAGTLLRAMAEGHLSTRARPEEVVEVAATIPQVAHASLEDPDRRGRRNLRLVTV